MRKSRWAEPEEEEIRDEPVTLTEKQYRALKRGSLFGTLGLLFGVVAIGLAAWSLLRTPGQEANPTLAQAAQPMETTPAPETVTTAVASPLPSMIPSPTPAATKTTASTPARKTTTTRKAVAPDATTEKPVTEPASSVIGDTPTPPAPTPVQAEPVKPVGGSDSGH